VLTGDPETIFASGLSENRILTVRTGTSSLLEIEFDNNQRNEQADFRPELGMELSEEVRKAE